MSPRVAYWTSAFHAEMEAIASEVALLRSHFPGSVTWGVSGSNALQMSWRRGFVFPPRLHLLFRGATALAQYGFHVNHLVGGVGDWFHLKAICKRPTVLTVALYADCCDKRLLQSVDRFVVEWPNAREDLARLGVPSERIELVFPSVDTAKFRPRPVPAAPFTVLFASSPDRAEWLTGRGVWLLLQTAALRPDYHFRLLWRPWGDSLDAVRTEIARQGLLNVELRAGVVRDMATQFANTHVVIAPFIDPYQCKPAPNSLIEALACGRPVVATEVVGIADLLEDKCVGTASTTHPEDLAQSLDRAAANWDLLAGNAPNVARRFFNAQQFVARYTSIYAELVAKS